MNGLLPVVERLQEPVLACSRRVDAALKIHTALTQTVWGSTQENDIAYLRKKLEQRPGSLHLIQTHVGVGYRMLRVEPDEL